MEQKIRKRAMINLLMSSMVLVLYLVGLLVYNFYYIKELNGLFTTLSLDTSIIEEIEDARLATNVEFIKYELLFGIVGAFLMLTVFICIAKLLKVYENLAFRDLLTGCRSKESLEAFFNKMEKKKKILSLSYFLFDLNYLKELNDEYGRSKGDEFLKAMSECLKSVFGSNVYRISGEEFAAIYTGDVNPYLLIDKVNEKIDDYNVNKNDTDITLSFAKGFSKEEYDYSNKNYRDTVYKNASISMHEDSNAFKRILPRVEKSSIDNNKEVNVRKL